MRKLKLWYNKIKDLEGAQVGTIENGSIIIQNIDLEMFEAAHYNAIEFYANITCFYKRDKNSILYDDYMSSNSYSLGENIGYNVEYSSEEDEKIEFDDLGYKRIFITKNVKKYITDQKEIENNNFQGQDFIGGHYNMESVDMSDKEIFDEISKEIIKGVDFLIGCFKQNETEWLEEKNKEKIEEELKEKKEALERQQEEYYAEIKKRQESMKKDVYVNKNNIYDILEEPGKYKMIESKD